MQRLFFLLSAITLPAALALLPAAPAPKKPVPITNSIGMKLLPIPKGTFNMGSSGTETGRRVDEGPVHKVEISRSFYMGAYEVTQDEYKKVMGKNPSFFSSTGAYKNKVKGVETGKFPVENVSHDEAVEFCKKLSALAAEKNAGRK